MPPILGRKGVTPPMRFPCCDCGEVTTGEEVIDGTYLYIVHQHKDDPTKSVWRCECCQDEWLDQQQDQDTP